MRSRSSGQALAAFGAKCGSRWRQRRLLGQFGFDFGEGASFQLAKAALAQAWLGHQGRARGIGHSPAGGMGALQVAGVDDAGRLTRQGARQLARLPLAGAVERNVQVALDARVHVPGGLAVAHGNDAGGLHFSGPVARGQAHLARSTGRLRETAQGGVEQHAKMAGSSVHTSSCSAEVSYTTCCVAVSRSTRLTSRRCRWGLLAQHHPGAQGAAPAQPGPQPTSAGSAASRAGPGWRARPSAPPGVRRHRHAASRRAARPGAPVPRWAQRPFRWTAATGVFPAGRWGCRQRTQGGPAFAPGCPPRAPWRNPPPVRRQSPSQASETSVKPWRVSCLRG